MRQTAGVIEHRTVREERMTGVRQTQATQVFVIPECPSPRETHPRRESNEESPGRPLCGFHLLPRNITRPARPAAVRPPLIGAGQVSVIHSSPFLRKTHPHRESNEESPESQWLFGAGLGARSPQRTPRGKHGKANVITQKRSYAAPPTSFSASLRSPSGSP